MKVELVDWPVEEHGLIWKLTDVFNESELKSLRSIIEDAKTTNNALKSVLNNDFSIVNQNKDPNSDDPRKRDVHWHSVQQVNGHQDYYENLAQITSSFRAWNLEFLKQMRKSCVEHGLQELPAELEPTGIDHGVFWTIPDSSYKEHYDVSVKLSSTVIYLDPENDANPTFWISDLNGKRREIPYESNTGYTFIRNSKSRHCYHNTRDVPRFSYMLNFFSHNDSRSHSHGMIKYNLDGVRIN